MASAELQTSGTKAPQYPISKNWQTQIENAVGEIQDEVWGDPRRQMVGLKDRMREQEEFKKSFEKMQWKINGIAVGLGIQAFAFLVWLANISGLLHIGG